MNAEETAKRFRLFVEEQSDSSALYRGLGTRILEDPEVLAIAARSPEEQPTPHLFLGAVQFLLTREGQGFRAGEEIDGAYARLRALARGRTEALVELLNTRKVQTNEVRRSIFLFTAFATLARYFPDRPFALVEIGASAGFNLLFDRYEYQYGDREVFGHLGSELLLGSELRGRSPSTEMPSNPVVARIGLDLDPIDLGNETDLDWLRALIWPEPVERRERLEHAIAIRRRNPVEMVKGDAVDLLAPVLAGVPSEVVPFVFHTYVANQLSLVTRAILLDEIDRQGARRDIVHLHNCIEPHLHATLYRSGERIDLPMARTDAHARWVEWLG